jgi:hypothetical protein
MQKTRKKKEEDMHYRFSMVARRAVFMEYMQMFGLNLCSGGQLSFLQIVWILKNTLLWA